jgi:ribosomal protein S18 acetylase RimI-like enzyme
MFTKPEYRGRGINKMIIERLNDWAKSKKLKEVRLDVYSDNESAIRAYKKAGFKKHMVTMRIEI